MTTIRTVHVRRAAGDPVLIRLRLEQVLGAADLRPPGLSPAAILCVRRLRDPLPGRLTLGTFSPSPAWEQAMRALLGDMAARAARPALGTPPPDAPAVRFEDRAELLACLARDWCAGILAGRWWWRTLLHEHGPVRYDLTGRLYTAWRATPEAVPAALAHLHTSGDAARFLALLPDAEVQALSRAVATIFGLPMLQMRAATSEPGEPAVSLPAALAVLDLAADTRALDPERRMFYAAGVLLVRAPAVARAAWPLAIERWARGAVAAAHAVPRPADSGTPPEVPPSLPDLSQSPHRAGGLSERVPGTLDEPVVLPQPDLPALPPWHTPPDDRTLADAVPGAEIAPAGTDTTPWAGEPAHEPALLGASLWPAAIIETRYGGLVFLLNLALHLDLYGDFTQPLQPGIDLSPWTLLAELGKQLLPHAPQDDPLWELLVKLAGEEPGVGFTPPPRWQAPCAWLTPFGKRRRYRIARGGASIQVRHPAGFVVREQPWPWRRRRRRHSAYRGVPWPFEHPAGTLAGWIERLACYTRARLALALGGEAEVTDGLALPARIHAGDVRLDVMFVLNELPIEVRLAGLDRDPGWIPAAGRDIRFHFE